MLSGVAVTVVVVVVAAVLAIAIDSTIASGSSMTFILGSKRCSGGSLTIMFVGFPMRSLAGWTAVPHGAASAADFAGIYVFTVLGRALDQRNFRSGSRTCWKSIRFFVWIGVGTSRILPPTAAFATNTTVDATSNDRTRGLFGHV